MTKVVNIKTGASYDVYIGRSGHGKDGYFGNPYPLQQGEPRGSTIDRYTDYFIDRVERDQEFRRRIMGLKGKTLGCFCKPAACHGDVIVKWIESHSETTHKLF